MSVIEPKYKKISDQEEIKDHKKRAKQIKSKFWQPKENQRKKPKNEIKATNSADQPHDRGSQIKQFVAVVLPQK